MARILKAKIRQISLCPRGANMMPVIYKSEEGRVELDTLIKSDMEDNGEITAIVYAPENPDAQGDVASKEAIKEMCNEFPVSGEGVDIRHDGKVLEKERAYVAQSFIVDGGDSRFRGLKKYDGSEAGDMEGAWAVVIKVDDPELRRAYREGEWQGVSMAGPAVIEDDSQKEASLLKRLISLVKNSGTEQDPQGEIDMQKDELQKALDSQADTITKGVSEAITNSLREAGLIKEEAKDKNSNEGNGPEAPVFKGDFSNEDEVREFEKELAIFEAEKEHGNDPVALFKARREIEKEFSPSDEVTDAEAGIEKADSPEVKALKRKLAKEQRKSNQPSEKGDSNETAHVPAGLRKEDNDLAVAGSTAVKKMYGGKD